MVYHVAFDGSGTQGQHWVISYAGFIGTPVQWGALGEAWQDKLDQFGLKFFKMAQAATCYGEFQGKEAIRDEAVWAFANLARRYELPVVGCAGGDANFEGMTQAQAKKQLFQGALYSIVNEIDPKHTVMLLCDREQDVEDSYCSWVDSLMDKRRDTARIVGLCFMDDKHFKQLQLADMIAFLVRQEGERVVEGRPDSEINPLYTFLMNGTKARVDFGPRTSFLDGMER
jgi:hypothetical protein